MSIQNPDATRLLPWTLPEGLAGKIRGVQFPGTEDRDFQVALSLLETIHHEIADLEPALTPVVHSAIVDALPVDKFNQIVETEEGTRYFTTGSGITLRIRKTVEAPDAILDEPRRIIGYADETISTEFQKLADGGFKDSFNHLKTEKSGDSFTITFQGLRKTRSIGLKPVEIYPYMNSLISLDIEDGGEMNINCVIRSRIPDYLIPHFGHKITKIIK